MKILIIRFSSIGDIVLTTPVARVLSQQAGAEVHYLTKPAFASILLANPYISKVITLSDDFPQMVTMLKSEAYDHIVDLHHNLRSTRLKIALRRPSTAFKKLNFEKWLMVNFKINRLPQLHIVDRYLNSIRHLNVKNDHRGLDFFLPEISNVNTQEVFGIAANGYATIVIGAAHETKCMSSNQIVDLCRRMDMPVILLGGRQEISKAEDIIAKVNSPHVRSACGGFDIFQSTSILQQAATIISHDTGLMHITAALQKPQVVVWGNTIPEFGMYPYYGSNNVEWTSFEQKELYCRPCSKIGFKECPQKHFKCMLDHDIQEIADSARKLVRGE